jgi:hypothetical protein
VSPIRMGDTVKPHAPIARDNVRALRTPMHVEAVFHAQQQETTPTRQVRGTMRAPRTPTHAEAVFHAQQQETTPTHQLRGTMCAQLGRRCTWKRSSTRNNRRQAPRANCAGQCAHLGRRRTRKRSSTRNNRRKGPCLLLQVEEETRRARWRFARQKTLPLRDRSRRIKEFRPDDGPSTLRAISGAQA